MSISENDESPEKSKEAKEIQTHNFEDEKSSLNIFLKNFSSQEDLHLPKVPTHRFFGLLNRDVTGSDQNALTVAVQGQLEIVMDHLGEVFKELKKIYETFESLDKDYIQGLIAGNKAAEVASIQATQAAREAYKVAEQAKKNTGDIERLIETQSIIIDKLVLFKERIENITNIDNVSTMSKDIQDLKNEVADSDAIIKERFVVQDRRIFKQNEELVALLNKNKVDLSDALADAKKEQLAHNSHFTSQIETIHSEIKINQATINERLAAQNSQLLKKIKIAYLIAGTFGVIEMTHFVLALLRIV